MTSATVVKSLTDDEAKRFVKDLLLTNLPLEKIEFTALANSKQSFYGPPTVKGEGSRRKFQLAFGNFKSTRRGLG